MAIRLGRPVDGGDVGVGQDAGGGGLRLQLLEIARAFALGEFEGDPAPELPIPGLPDLPHPPVAQQLHPDEITEAIARLGCGGVFADELPMGFRHEGFVLPEQGAQTEAPVAVGAVDLVASSPAAAAPGHGRHGSPSEGRPEMETVSLRCRPPFRPIYGYHN